MMIRKVFDERDGGTVVKAAVMRPDGVFPDIAYNSQDDTGFILTFAHLQRSGRVTRLQAYAATALDIKPVFAFRGGEPAAVARPRTRRRALDRVVAETTAAAAGRPVRLAAIHARAEAEARDVADRVEAEIPVVERYVVEVTPVVGVHVGPGLVGTAIAPEPD